MTVLRSCSTLVTIFTAACLFGTQAVAQQPGAAASSYQRGVEEYLAGNGAAAEPLFAQAIRQDARDPRPYYFRALCQLQQGRRIEARADMLVGAALEARAQGAYPVAQSLAQVPDAERLLLDEFRWRAGIVRAVTQPENDGNEIVRPIATDAGVLRQRVAVRLDQLVRPVSLAELVRESALQPTITEAPIVPTPIAQSPLAEPTAPSVEPATSADEPPAGDPFADDQPSAQAGKIPSGKLMGILGRALLKSTPVQSLEALREKIPAVPLPGVTGNSPAATASPAADAAAAPAGEDPFAEPTSPPTEKTEQREEHWCE